MKGAVLFLLCLVAGASVGAMLADAPEAPRAAAPLEAASVAPAPPVVEDGVVPLDLTGALATGALACTSAAQCQPLRAEDPQDSFLLASGEAVASLDLELSWNANTRVTQELRMSLVACARVCSPERAPVLATAQGTSPLRLTRAYGDEAPADGNLILLVTTPDLAPLGLAEAYASVEQPFRVTGALVLR